MTYHDFPHTLSLLPKSDIRIEVLKIPELIRFLLHSPPDPGYHTQRPGIFGRDDFRQNFLSDGELDYLNAFKAMKKQIEWLSGRFAAKQLVKKVLMKYQDLPEIEIRYREQGAPFLKAFPTHCLSLSHSGIYTAVAVTKDPDVLMGIDLEKIGKQPDTNFMKTAFTDRERQAMEDRPVEIFRHWTLKEAYLKYIRLGFNESLHHVEIIRNKVWYHGNAQNLDCWSRELDHGYILSMVSDPK